jgi:hypothetical protein
LSETPNFDIVGAWRNFLGKWETAGNSLGGQVMGTPEFSTAINQATCPAFLRGDEYQIRSAMTSPEFNRKCKHMD